MRILIPTIGSRGDVQPFIALAQGLEREGHRVTMASHPLMRTLVESYGVRFAPVGPDIDLAREVAAIRGHARIAAIGLLRGMRFGFDMYERSHDDILALCCDTDLVVVPSSVATGKNEAELLDVPYLTVTLMPWAIPWHDPGRPLHKRIGYGIIDGLVHLVTTRPLNRIRKQQGLPPVGSEGVTSPLLNLVPVSPAVFPPNPLWEPRHQLTGYWFAEDPPVWVPPNDLQSFLEGGDPPVLVSLGAMSLGDDARASASLFIEAFQQASVRGIIQGWQAGIKGLNLPVTIFAAGSLPHDWLMTQCVGVVHHGGFGTTGAGLRAGIPALVIPHIVDQFYWGQQVHKLGVGPQPIPRSKLDKDGLAAGIDKLIRSDELHNAASTLGEQIKNEHGLENALRLIHETFA